MLLRPGNAGSNTFTDHKEVLAAALRQVPSRFRRLIMVRVDGAGASHDLVEHLLALNSRRRTVLFTTGWMITAAGEDAIGNVPASAWKPGTSQDGAAEDDKDTAEITHLLTRAGSGPPGAGPAPMFDELPDARLGDEEAQHAPLEGAQRGRDGADHGRRLGQGVRGLAVGFEVVLAAIQVVVDARRARDRGADLRGLGPTGLVFSPVVCHAYKLRVRRVP
jgi:hypothetical protein